MTHYRFALNEAAYGNEHAVATPIQLSALPTGTNQLRVLGRNTEGFWQTETNATVAAGMLLPPLEAAKLEYTDFAI